MNKYNKPDFLCIGYQKTGTSWLHTQLSKHPEVTMPFVKETHYLLNKSKGRRRKWLTLKRIIQAIKERPELFKWFLKWYLLPASDKWYVSLFDKNKISGEIAPTYVRVLPEKIKKRFPNLKIIILLREPVDRMWSFLKMDLAWSQNRKSSEISEKEWIGKFESIKSMEPSYMQLISLWSSHFDQVCVRFYDEISEHPEFLYSDILKFIGCENTHYTDTLDLQKKVFPGVVGIIPKALKQKLILHYKREVEQLAADLDSPYPKKWLAAYK